MLEEDKVSTEGDSHGIDDCNEYVYEVYFKCHLNTYLSCDPELVEGDVVTVQAQSHRGFDVGVVSRSVPRNSPYFAVAHRTSTLKITSKCTESEVLELKKKLSIEEAAVNVCRKICAGAGLQDDIVILNSEIQFDSRQITFYYQNCSDSSLATAPSLNLDREHEILELLFKKLKTDVSLKYISKTDQRTRELECIERRYLELSSIYSPDSIDESHTVPQLQEHIPPPVGVTTRVPELSCAGLDCPVLRRAPDMRTPQSHRSHASFLYSHNAAISNAYSVQNPCYRVQAPHIQQLSPPSACNQAFHVPVFHANPTSRLVHIAREPAYRLPVGGLVPLVWPDHCTSHSDIVAKS
mmetsp:Transcript_14343/g.21489  ORF Transcript_14343/g.21489 Transcript_14343/m.21489 type:complete len:352 (-) Transcript_14343:424-1479(-)|eukprot:CAMPEP_0185040994 /NCGR_PEP_ID=MMETSP1103-20130426/39761_1 /TAXON_ID=36769 /ORGANISM="Paraphysomonas bandaiensis, Strain Caron Lab Isolate" /LENGTH=351 /DNA_ID=CAMNT_0027580549 /DNA_START=57 /DNA_END=1112 /DNA_ORIENTATION=-